MPKRNDYPFAASPAGLWQQIELAKLPVPEHEFKFHPERKFAFDFAWPAIRLGLEYQGLFMRNTNLGGHQTLGGIQRDIEKLNEAQILGWDVLLFTAGEVRSGDALLIIEKYLTARLIREQKKLSPGMADFAQYFFRNNRKLA